MKRNVKSKILEKGDHGKSLPQVVFELLDLPSLKKARKLIEMGCCSVNGAVRRFASYKACYRDLVEVILPDDTPRVQGSLSIVYQDDHFLVVDKPAGALVEARSLSKQLGLPLSKCLLVHRLDKETSGLLLIAKDEPTKELFLELFRKRLIQKEYLALVDGYVPSLSGVIQKPLEEKKRIQNELVWGVVEHGRGKEAITEYQVLKRKKEASFLIISPKTGRTHQIRVHMAYIGHPILGDYRYGTCFSSSIRPKRHLLHAYSLSIPSMNKTFFSPIPFDFDMVLKDLFGASCLTQVLKTFPFASFSRGE